MFAIADKSISIQHLHFTISTTHKRKYRYVKFYITTVYSAGSLSLTDLEVKRWR